MVNFEVLHLEHLTSEVEHFYMEIQIEVKIQQVWLWIIWAG